MFLLVGCFFLFLFCVCPLFLLFFTATKIKVNYVCFQGLLQFFIFKEVILSRFMNYLIVLVWALKTCKHGGVKGDSSWKFLFFTLFRLLTRPRHVSPLAFFYTHSHCSSYFFKLANSHSYPVSPCRCTQDLIHHPHAHPSPPVQMLLTLFHQYLHLFIPFIFVSLFWTCQLISLPFPSRSWYARHQLLSCASSWLKM